MITLYVLPPIRRHVFRDSKCAARLLRDGWCVGRRRMRYSYKTAGQQEPSDSRAGMSFRLAAHEKKRRNTMSFLKDNSRFCGTGEKNRNGESLEEFLAGYDPKKYDNPSNTTDIVVVCSPEKLERWGQPLKVLLVKRSNHPSIGFWAVPGGFVELKEDLFEGAARELEEETGLKGLPLKQLVTWGEWDRDPRWRVITTSFLALIEGEAPVKAGDDAADALWMDVDLNEEETGENGFFQVWNLSLSCREKNIFLGAKVGITRSGNSLLTQEKYHLIAADGLAVDHGCIITQALLYLKERLK